MTVKEIREITGLSQAEFCKKYEIPENTLKQWEQGTRKPPEYLLTYLHFFVTHHK